MCRQERADSFWTEEDGSPLTLLKDSPEGTEIVVDGFRFRWVRNELGQLYRSSVGAMVGAHLAKSYSIREYQAEMEKRALEHEKTLPLSVRLAIQPYIVQAMFEMPSAPQSISSQRTGAVFEGRLF